MHRKIEAAVLFVLALALAGAGQYLLSHKIDLLAGLLCYAVGVALFILLLRQERASQPLKPTPFAASLGLVAILNLSSLYFFRSDPASSSGMVLWGLSLLLLFVAAWYTDRKAGAKAVGEREPWTAVELAMLLSVLLLALFLRIYRLDQFPGVYEDEGLSLLDAFQVLDGEIRSPFGVGLISRSSLFSYAVALWLRLGVDNIWALKLMGVVPGVLTGLFVYLLARESFGKAVAWIAAFLLAVSSWQVLTSRWGYEMATEALGVTASLYFLVMGFRTGKRTDFALSGLGIGLVLILTRAASAVTPLIALAFLAYLVVRLGKGLLREHYQGLVIAFAVAFLLFAPRGLYIVQNSAIALVRVQEVFLFDSSQWGQLKANPVGLVFRNLWETFLTFNYQSGYEPRWNVIPRQPTLDFVTGVLFLLGLGWSLYNWKRPSHFLLLAIFWIALLPASFLLFLDDRPVTYRAYGATPAVYIFAAIALWQIWNRVPLDGRLGRIVGGAAVALALGYTGWANYDAYFNRYANSHEAWYATGQIETRVARQVNRLGKSYQVYVTDEDVYKPTLEAITGRQTNYVPIRSLEQVPVIQKVEKDVAFVVVVVGNYRWSSGEFGPQLLKRLSRYYPNGLYQEGERTIDGKVIYATYVVSAAEIALATSPSELVAEAPQLVATWGTQGSGPGQFQEPRDVAVDSQGNVYVVDSGNFRIQKFDHDGRFLAQWGERGEGDGQFAEPLAVATTRNDEVLVLDSGTGWIQRFTSDGKFLGKLAGPEARLFHPRGLAVDQEGNIYIANTGFAQVVKLSPVGERLTEFGGRGSGPGQMAGPVGLAMDEAGGLYEADVENQRVQKFDSKGNFLGGWGADIAGYATDGPHLALDLGGRVYLTDPHRHRVLIYHRDGKLLVTWGEEGQEPGQFRLPVAIALDRWGNIYVADTLNHRIQKFRLPSGQ